MFSYVFQEVGNSGFDVVSVSLFWRFTDCWPSAGVSHLPFPFMDVGGLRLGAIGSGRAELIGSVGAIVHSVSICSWGIKFVAAS